VIEEFIYTLAVADDDGIAADEEGNGGDESTGTVIV
jgi:hypothetical protein